MAQAKEQLPLKLTRARVPLAEDAAVIAPLAKAVAHRLLDEERRRSRVPLVEEDEEPVRLRVPKAVAEAVQADPAAAVRAMAKAAEEKLAAITEKNLAVGQRSVDGGALTTGPEQGPGFPVNEDPTAFTNWESEQPPTWKGFYDVTDHKSGTLNARWWFGGAFWQKGDPEEARRTGVRLSMLSHLQFSTQYAWRGLRECPSDPYPLPPYVMAALPPGVGIDGKYVKRKRA